MGAKWAVGGLRQGLAGPAPRSPSLSAQWASLFPPFLSAILSRVQRGTERGGNCTGLHSKSGNTDATFLGAQSKALARSGAQRVGTPSPRVSGMVTAPPTIAVAPRQSATVLRLLLTPAAAQGQASQRPAAAPGGAHAPQLGTPRPSKTLALLVQGHSPLAPLPAGLGPEPAHHPAHEQLAQSFQLVSARLSIGPQLTCHLPRG